MAAYRPTSRVAEPPVAIQRAAIYTRKSTSAGLEQEFNSLDAQRDACEGYIRSQAHAGWRVVPEAYDDGGFTGANIERPAFQRLLADAEAGRIDVVVVHRVDRLSRSLLDFAAVMDRFNRHGVAFVSVTQNFSTASAMGRLTLNMLMSFAEFEREMICERTRDKIAASRRRGKWTGGRLPYGYAVRDKKLVVNRVEALVVKEAFYAYLATRSLLGVIRALNEKGCAPRTQTARRKGWRTDHVLRMLRSPVYAGLLESGGELHEAEHEALVPRETWERVQALLGARHDDSKPEARTRNPGYLLVGLLRCGSCGAAMTPATARAHGKQYRYYRCATRDKQGRNACPSRPLPAQALEGFVVDRIREATTGPAGRALAADVVAAIRAKVDHEREDLAVERRGLPGRIAHAAAEKARLARNLQRTRNAALRAVIEDQIGHLADEHVSREQRLAAIDARLAALDAARVEADWIGAALRDFESLWEAMTPENRVRLVRAVVDRVEVDEATGTIEAHLVSLAENGPARQGAFAGVAG
jgi:DNA invertase Pin-like site-specific DNA recombinase